MKDVQNPIASFKAFALLALLLLAFFIAFIPHIDYHYPVHVDEWNQLAYVQAMLNEGSIDFAEPFYGEWNSGINYNVFPGYYLLLGVIQKVCDVDIIYMPLYLPGIIFIFTVLSVYSYARRKGFGWEAGFFTCLIPTTVGILGPGFMVPVATGLLIIPLLLFLIDHENRISSYILCFIFSCFLMLIHLPSAIIMIIIIIPYIVLKMIKNPGRAVCLLIVILIPFIFTAIVIYDALVFEIGKEAFINQFVPTYVEFPALIQLYGYLPLLCAFLGIFIFVMKNRINNYGLIFSLIALLFTLVIFYRFHFGLPLVYLRALLFTLLILGIIAGAGLAGIRIINIRMFNVGRYLYAGIVIVILIVALPARLAIPYYKMMDENDYHAFTWIKENVNDAHDLAVLDPWKATAFNVVTDKKVYQRIFPVQEPIDDMIYNFLDCECSDTPFLEYNGITIIYSNDICENTDIINIREDVYLLNQGSSQYYVKENLLDNSGMWEITVDGHPAYWYTWEENVTSDFLYPEPGRTCGYSVGIKISDDSNRGTSFSSVWFQRVPVTEKNTYILGGWIKTDNIRGNDGAHIVVNWHDSNNEWVGRSDIMQYLTGTHDWCYYEGEVTAPEGAKYCIVSCRIVNSTGSTWFDDMLFMKSPIHYQ